MAKRPFLRMRLGAYGVIADEKGGISEILHFPDDPTDDFTDNLLDQIDDCPQREAGRGTVAHYPTSCPALGNLALSAKHQVENRIAPRLRRDLQLEVLNNLPPQA